MTDLDRRRATTRFATPLSNLFAIPCWFSSIVPVSSNEGCGADDHQEHPDANHYRLVDRDPSRGDADGNGDQDRANARSYLRVVVIGEPPEHYR